jgi:hypothetical protein
MLIHFILAAMPVVTGHMLKWNKATPDTLNRMDRVAADPRSVPAHRRDAQRDDTHHVRQ